jgi:hypothetical protein
MIPLDFYLFWAGAKLSYLRYLTFKSLRHFHKESKITLYTAREFDKSVHSWSGEKQDFEENKDGKDYIEDLPSINVEIKNIKCVGNEKFCPILQADLARWLMLRENGGFYLDTDQIILKSFDSLPLDREFIYCRYNEVQCGDYLPTGVLGLEKDSQIANIALDEVVSSYRKNNYNSSGPWAMRKLITMINLDRSFNAPYFYFYPLPTSKDVGKIYNGQIKIEDRSYAIHWFGGSKTSQEFNNIYTEEYSKTSKDTISIFLKERGIL